jgi:hypothetical protein
LVSMMAIGEGGLEVRLGVVVTEGDGAGDLLVAEVPAVLDEAGADQAGPGQGHKGNLTDKRPRATGGV